MHRPSKRNAADSPECALLSRRWVVDPVSLLGHSVRINAHVVHDNAKNQARHCLNVRRHVGNEWHYAISRRHLKVDIALILRSFGVEGSELWTGQSETRVSSFVTNVPCVCCVFHYRPSFYVNPQQLYSSRHHLVLKKYKSTHNIRTLDHQQHVFFCCKDV